MLYRLLADLVLILHLGFILFILLGGLLALCWRWVVFLHVPAALWGILIEFAGWPCPLTPWEKSLRRLGGEAGYEGGFVEHYVLWILYPSGLSRSHHVLLGLVVLVVNLAIYWKVRARWRREG